MRSTLSVLSLFLAGGIFILGIPSEAKEPVTYKPAGEATLNYPDGVTVHRHPDGSVEVSEPASAPTPLDMGSGSAPARRVVHHKTVAHKVTTTKTTKKK